MAICEQCGVDVAPGDVTTERVGVGFLHFCSAAHAAQYIEEQREVARKESAAAQPKRPAPSTARKPSTRKKQTPQAG